MPKDAYYFFHDSNAKRDEKIISLRKDYGWEGYGWFWALIEEMREAGDYKISHNCVDGYEYELRIDDGKLSEFIKDCIEKYELFKSDGKKFWSKRLMRNMESMEMAREKKKRAGKKGAKKRWSQTADKKGVNSSAIAPPKQPHGTGVAKDGRKEKKRKEKSKKEKSKKEKIRKDKIRLKSSCPNKSPDDTREEKPKFDKDTKPYQAAVFLRDHILENNKRTPVPKPDPKSMEDWALAMDRLHRLGPPGGEKDGYSWAEIRELIEWCQQDDFWWENILSAPKFRKQIVKLENGMKNGNNKNVMKELYEYYHSGEGDKEEDDD